MDETTWQHYIPTTMRFLLVLSAFLTALVGFGTVAPAVARPASEVCASASVRAERRAPRIIAVSPQKSAALDRVNSGAMSPQNAPVRSVPLYAERLRV